MSSVEIHKSKVPSAVHRTKFYVAYNRHASLRNKLTKFYRNRLNGMAGHSIRTNNPSFLYIRIRKLSEKSA